MCEFTANNAISDSIQVSPFFPNFGKDPRMNVDLDGPVTNPEEARAHEAAANLPKIHDLLRSEMTTAQYRYSEANDKTPRSTPRFEPGDSIWLDTCFINTTCPARKLDWTKLGPFPIKRAVWTHAYELEFPLDIKIHPV